jgi:hypothetical protein
MAIMNGLVLLDWGAAQRAARLQFTKRRRKPEDLAEEAIRELDRRVALGLSRTFPKTAFRLRRRIYNGWHQGTTPTPERRTFEVVQRALIKDPTRIDRVSFEGEFGWGNELLCDGVDRILYDTLVGENRFADSPGGKPRKTQRMVDTAICADLAWAARSHEYDHLIVVADDDDIWPGIVLAKAWKAVIQILRVTRNSENRHLNTRPFLIS